MAEISQNSPNQLKQPATSNSEGCKTNQFFIQRAPIKKRAKSTHQGAKVYEP